MTKSELRKQRREAAANGVVWIVEDGRPQQVIPRTKAQERKHSEAMHKWARRYNELNGGPENENDR